MGLKSNAGPLQELQDHLGCWALAGPSPGSAGTIACCQGKGPGCVCGPGPPTSESEPHGPVSAGGPLQFEQSRSGAGVGEPLREGGAGRGEAEPVFVNKVLLAHSPTHLGSLAAFSLLAWSGGPWPTEGAGPEAVVGWAFQKVVSSSWSKGQFSHWLPVGVTWD